MEHKLASLSICRYVPVSPRQCGWRHWPQVSLAIWPCISMDGADQTTGQHGQSWPLVSMARLTTGQCGWNWPLISIARTDHWSVLMELTTSQWGTVGGVDHWSLCPETDHWSDELTVKLETEGHHSTFKSSSYFVPLVPTRKIVCGLHSTPYCKLCNALCLNSDRHQELIHLLHKSIGVVIFSAFPLLSANDSTNKILHV